MLTAIQSYAIFNIKMLLKDKIPLLWSIGLPLITFIINYKNILTEWDMVYWWTYIIICSYVYGISIYALQLKESGSLKTIFSIKNSPWSFFLGNLLTQIIFSFINITILNIFVVIFLKFSIIKLFLYSLITIMLCIPIAFVCYNLTLLKKVHANTINSIFSIIIFASFILLNTDSHLNNYNPLYFISNIIIKHSLNSMLMYIILSIILMLVSAYSVTVFEPISNERR